MTLSDIQAAHTIQDQELQRVKDKIEMRKLQIYRLERKKKRAYEKTHWTTQLINPVMREVEKLTPHIKWKIEDKPFVSGMRCNCSVFGKTIEGAITVGITFTPGAGSNLNFDIGEVRSGFQRGSIGDLNGFNQRTKQLENIQELVDLVARSEQEEKIRRKEKHDEFKGEFIEGDSVVVNNKERGILHKYLEPGFCEIFFAGERGVEKVRVYIMRKPTEWEMTNPDRVESW
jgi:hypothetical protein